MRTIEILLGAEISFASWMHQFHSEAAISWARVPGIRTDGNYLWRVMVHEVDEERLLEHLRAQNWTYKIVPCEFDPAWPQRVRSIP